MWPNGHLISCIKQISLESETQALKQYFSGRRCYFNQSTTSDPSLREYCIVICLLIIEEPNLLGSLDPS